MSIDEFLAATEFESEIKIEVLGGTVGEEIGKSGGLSKFTPSTVEKPSHQGITSLGRIVLIAKSRNPLAIRGTFVSSPAKSV
ncbi:hypothetical protein WG66_011917 [Moniliophthora roreri]|nr:hypothetical protein WG66_011917 [Moniliophthora roreri]